MFPDDFLSLVALDAPRPGIRTDHVSIHIQDQQCIVLNRIHEQSEPFFAGAQTIFGLLALGNIARDFRKTGQGAALVPDRRQNDFR
jgi:hypothetical protein